MFFRNLYPNQAVYSAYDLDWETLSMVYRGVMFDIDNTLVPHGAPADERAKRLFVRLRGLGMGTMLVSNNGEERVRPFAEQVDSGYVCKAGKPKAGGYLEAMRRMGTTPANTLFVGDQIFTDIWGARRAGVFTILTDPLDPSTDEPQIVVKRLLERPFRRPGHYNVTSS
ncbi:MAG: HAD-IIIA family hydrolase [Lachnospiraceae bacterium]|nr:HAD-IIIA family hydrolase [Lachnospiraceae bacterium]